MPLLYKETQRYGLILSARSTVERLGNNIFEVIFKEEEEEEEDDDEPNEALEDEDEEIQKKNTKN